MAALSLGFNTCKGNNLITMLDMAELVSSLLVHFDPKSYGSLVKSHTHMKLNTHFGVSLLRSNF